jgi:hypothetical protein
MAFAIGDQCRRAARSTERGLRDCGLARAWQRPKPFATTTEATTIRLYPKQLLRALKPFCVHDPLAPPKQTKTTSALFKLDDSYGTLCENLPEEVDHGACAATSVTTGATEVSGDFSVGREADSVLHRCDHERLELIWR